MALLAVPDWYVLLCEADLLINDISVENEIYFDNCYYCNTHVILIYTQAGICFPTPIIHITSP